jgi:anti-sigma factor RsiW
MKGGEMGHAETVQSGASERYLLGELGEEESARYEQHFFACGECAEEVEMSAAFLDAMREVLDDYFVDSPRVQWCGLFCARPHAASPSLPVGTAMLRSLVVASRSRALRRGLGSRDVSWVFLTDAGEAAQVIAVAPEQQVLRFTLAVDPARTCPRYRCSIQDARGRTVESAIVAGPVAGCDLHIAVPVSRLDFGSYEITLDGLDMAGTSISPPDLARYSFTYRTLED